ncbi:methylase involved in ubiquinone/menaquinone biosynthesis [Xenococcus sp. PCC 7305]|uniref:class I SAM-dependent methyltransferase n=1 Tax=Xenococcus sp. PCC 7305 TaxID=102125 RepID=UPI0002AC8708|nr:class I SAM-dependent methyltransferase [Xenococcus sp. PCC 7305]ELS03001.1 methylase involved in ubiquinone/menaquinone biosynthesis [Xenococcus sp. PCC 7305]
MTVTLNKKTLGLASRLVNGILAIKPLADFAKTRARKMMIDRAEVLGVPWRKNVDELSKRDWDLEWNTVVNPQLQPPDYYLTSFHAYPEGNLSWKAAWEVESAAYAVHAKIWPEAGAKGDAALRQSYHQVLQEQLSSPPQTIVDLGCGVGMSTLALQNIYPQAHLTGVDLSAYFLAVASYRASQVQNSSLNIDWLNVAAEDTGLPANSCDLVSACLVFHELPAIAAKKIITEARRILRPGGHLAIMDMNPRSAIFAKMPPYILTLLKSTEPYLDQYFDLDLAETFVQSGFTRPLITNNSPRHRTIIARLAHE